MSPSALKKVTGFTAGYSGEDQIRICLQRIVELGGVVQMQDLYAAMEAVLNPRGMTLSTQGKSSLRFFTNKKAVEQGYVYPYDKQSPGWRITPAGRNWLGDDNDSGEPSQGVSLLEYVDEVLTCLPVIEPEHLADPDSTTLTIEGLPAKIQATVRAMMELVHPAEVSIQLTLNRDGWHVMLDVHPEEKR